MILMTCAYAAEEETDVSDISEADEYVILANSRDSDVIEESGDSGDSDSSSADTVEGSDTGEGAVLNEDDENEPEETSSPGANDYSPVENEDGVLSSLGDDLDIDVTPTPEPTPEATPDPEEMTYEDELLTTLGNIQGMLIFFVVVLLCFFSYKFFRMFF